MTTTINASTSSGLVQTADTSGVLKVQSNGVTTNALAWVSFAGSSGTRYSSYNVSSVTRNSAGDYTINFTNALSDSNYAMVASVGNDSGASSAAVVLTNTYAPSTTSCRYGTGYISGTAGQATAYDYIYNRAIIFGN
jgi:hypothetical protein